MSPLTRISLKLPDWLLRAIDKGADNRATDRSNYIRQAVIDRLLADGIPTRRESGKSDPAKRNV